MAKCKYILTQNKEGGFSFEIPTSLNRDGSYNDLLESLKSLSDEDIINLSKQLKNIEKSLIVPESLTGIIVGQTSATYTFKNNKDESINRMFFHLCDVARKNNFYHEFKKQNIIQVSFDEDTPYEYLKDNDLILINNIGEIKPENKLKAILEKCVYKYMQENNIGGEIREFLKSKDEGLFNYLGISITSTLTPNDIDYLYFNSSILEKDSVIDFEDVDKQSIEDLNKNLTPIIKDNIQNVYEPKNREYVYNLKRGDLVLTEKPGFKKYAIFLDYKINSAGEYELKVIEPGAHFPRLYSTRQTRVNFRRYNPSPKYPSEFTPTTKYINLNLPKELYANYAFVYNEIRPGDRIKMGTRKYTVLNLVGSNFVVRNSKGEEEIKFPGNSINSVELNPNSHPELNYKGEGLSELYSESGKSLKEDRGLIEVKDVVGYGDGKQGLVLAIINAEDDDNRKINRYFVKDFQTDNVDVLTIQNINKHFINTVGYDDLTSDYKLNKDNVTINIDKFKNSLETEFNFIPYYKFLSIHVGDYIVKGNAPYIVVNSTQDFVRVFDGSTFINISRDNLTGSTIATKRQQDPKTAQSVIKRNSYYISSDINYKKEYYDSEEVEEYKNKADGYTVYYPISKKDIKLNEYTKVDNGNKLYSYHIKGDREVLKNKDNTTGIKDVIGKFDKVFEYLLPGAYLMFDNDAYKYWKVERQIEDKFLVSYSYIKNHKIQTVKRLVDKDADVVRVYMPRYATKYIGKMNEALGNTPKLNLNDSESLVESRELNDLNTLNEDNHLKSYDSPELINDMVELLQDKFGVSMNIINNSDLDQFDIENKDTLRAFVLNGEYFINIDKANITEPLHELLHMVLASMKYSDYDGYKKLVNTVSSHPLYNEVKSVYKEINSDVLEEVFIRLFSDTVRHKIKIDGSFTSEAFDNAVKVGVKEMFDLSNPLDDITSFDLMDKEVRDVLVDFSSKLVSGKTSLYNKENALTILSVSTTLRKLIKDNKLKEMCNGM